MLKMAGKGKEFGKKNTANVKFLLITGRFSGVVFFLAKIIK